MNIEPHPPDVACAGPDAPKCEQIDDLIRLLVTIRERWGNTAIRYSIQWGGNAMWAEDEQRQEIRRLEVRVAQLNQELRPPQFQLNKPKRGK